MPYEHRVPRRIPFADTDVAGIVHFSNFFRYMEETEHDFYRSMGLSVHTPTATGWIGWPRIQAECHYVRPLRFEEEVEVHLIVRRRQQSTIHYGFAFHRCPVQQPTPLAVGALSVVCAERDVARDSMKSAAMPAAFADQIEVAPDDVCTVFDEAYASAARRGGKGSEKR